MWERKYLLDVDRFFRQDFEDIFSITDKMVPYSGVVKWEKRKNTAICRNSIMTMWFEPEYEKSTRTFGGFQGAILRLGGGWKEFDERSSSMGKGESVEDTVRMLSMHSDIIVDRHRDPEHVYRITEYSSCPVVNGGNGSHGHPTQTILDLYTIKKKLKEVDNKTIAIVGDLKNGRTVHSLCRGIAPFNDVNVVGIYPRGYELPPEYIPKNYEGRQISMEKLDGAIKDIKPDVVYVTRPQLERESACQTYQITKESMKKVPPTSILMHPLPRDSLRGPEICPEVDSDPRAAYFEQAAYGLPVRMALTAMMLGYEREVNCNLL